MALIGQCLSLHQRTTEEAGQWGSGRTAINGTHGRIVRLTIGALDTTDHGYQTVKGVAQ